MAESRVAGFSSDSTADDIVVLPSQDPRFPLELERQVFEMAASSLGNIFNLILVASRVKEWSVYAQPPNIQGGDAASNRIEPLLYRVIVHGCRQAHGLPITLLETLIHKIGSKLPVFWSKSVKSLLFLRVRKPEDEPLGDIFAACTGLVRLRTALPHSRFLPALGNLPALRYLCTEVTALSSGANFVDFTHPVFRNITHLELLDIPPLYEAAHQICTGLVHIPKLTHIAFHALVMCRALFPLLHLFTHLRAFVLLAGTQSRDNLDFTHLAMEDRFVSIRQADWKKDWLWGADTGEDFWALADEFLAARRAGKVDREFGQLFPLGANTFSGSRFHINDEEDGWRVVNS
ncbi:hypothetical protein B0H16DRAFT_1446917 [Mycena metata]|uniref:Uncharacterized protein n=1 Tax=Mycena metata TaxID=1033252 RepID=A0AAD7P1P9_9AGAR|nr:hypothetical protein B0H16DRAFT_1446917 [Mycena metata]